MSVKGFVAHLLGKELSDHPKEKADESSRVLDEVISEARSNISTSIRTSRRESSQARRVIQMADEAVKIFRNPEGIRND